MPIRIGDRVVAESILRPGGVVSCDGARHSARTTSGFVDAGVPLVVIGGDNQGLIVTPEDQIPAGELPGLGSIVFSTYGDRIRAERSRDDRAIAAARWRRLVRLRRFGVPIGIAAGILGLAVMWGGPVNWFTAERWLNSLGILSAGGLFGWWWLPWVERELEEYDYSFTSFSIPTGALALGGFAAIGGWLTPRYGAGVAFIGALVGGGLLLIPLPLLLMFLGEGSETETHAAADTGPAAADDSLPP